MLFGIAADMPAPKPSPEDTLDADIAACDDMARLAIHGHARPETWAKLAGYLREVKRHRAVRNADTWPMCDADAGRMERAAEAIELLTAHRNELGEIVQTWLAYCDQAGVNEDTERHPDNPELNPVKALCTRSRAALARQS